ncbi:DUF1673 family protein [Methanolobus vulcani]|uniref:DUF1673 family protein n=1 Tax=Methanolobus vulcani TaxID=38026 RepID=A0A7Z8KMM2_9EURY|nr:DUF1673 family protein [Methanolobus vulcani]TQD24906.1 DUF1673 family protein [Methanolobus vulcani]
MTINVAETIRKVMGWCPNATVSKSKLSQQIDFVNTNMNSLRIPNGDFVRSKNVLFPANTSLFIILSVTILNVVLFLSRGMDYTVLIPITIGASLLFYFFVIRSIQSNIIIDDHGVHLESFELRNITIKYRDIRSVTPNKPIKFAASMTSLLAIPLLILVSLSAYSVYMRGGWQMSMLVFLIVPGYLLLKYKGDAKYRDVDTQLSIQCENKSRYSKWYEATSNYTIATDKLTASEVQDCIEHYRDVR